MKWLCKKFDSIHKKYPYGEPLLTLLFGIFIERYVNIFLNNRTIENNDHWYRDGALYCSVLLIILLCSYYFFFGSIQRRKSLLSKNRLAKTLENEGIKEIKKNTYTIEEKVKIFETVNSAITKE